MMQNMKTKHIISKLKPKAELVARNIYQQAECVSWWLSNSFWRIFSALYARTVDSPLIVAAKWVNTGDFAKKNQMESFKNSSHCILFINFNCLLTNSFQSFNIFRCFQIHFANKYENYSQNHDWNQKVGIYGSCNNDWTNHAQNDLKEIRFFNNHSILTSKSDDSYLSCIKHCFWQKFICGTEMKLKVKFKRYKFICKFFTQCLSRICLEFVRQDSYQRSALLLKLYHQTLHCEDFETLEHKLNKNRSI